MVPSNPITPAQIEISSSKGSEQGKEPEGMQIKIPDMTESIPRLS